MSCPDQDVLERLVLGQLAGPEAETLAQHLDQCERCARTVSSFTSEDTLAAAAHAQAPSQPQLERDAVEALVTRLTDLWPKEHSQAAATLASPRLSDPSTILAELLTPPLEPGELGRLGPYRVLKVLGAGGMGVVFLAEDPTLRRPVALKTLQPALAANPAARERFLREARAVAAIEDERIVPIYQVGEDRGIPFFAMQLLRGQTLEDRLRDAAATTGTGALPITEAVHIAHEIARGLAAAHARGVIHRDIKPANVWLESRQGDKETGRQGDKGTRRHGDTAAERGVSVFSSFRVRLLDFGLARGIDDAVSLTQPGQVTGTPAYLAPELLAGSSPDERCDLFGLGCVLYRMTTSRTAWTALRSASTTQAVAAPASPQSLNPEVPAELNGLILQLLAGDPACRPPSAQAVADRLAEIADELSSVTIAAGRRRHRPRWAWAALAAAALLVAVAGIIYVRTDRGEFVLEVSDSDVAVALREEGGIALHDRKTDRTFLLGVGKHDLPTGEYDIDVRETGKLEFSTRRFTIHRGDETKVAVFLRPSKVDPLDKWIAEVAELSAEEQVKAVGRKLQELNPEFDGNVGPRYAEQQVVEAHVITDHVTDIRPIKALRHLEIFVCRGSAPGRGILTDLAPVKALLKLDYLDCSANRIKDLAPLRGMLLRKLVAWENPIRDLTPLRGIPLASLDLNYTAVSDLRPIHNMPLRTLLLDAHYATDLEPLTGMPLREVRCRFRPERHTHVLRSIKSLETINDRPAEEFWKEQDARRALEPWIKRVAALPAKKQLAEVTAKLRELNPGFQGSFRPEIENDQVARIDIFVNEVTDISPLRALTNLKRLVMSGMRPGVGRLYDLDPIRELPIEFLQFNSTQVADLTPLVGMKVRVLLCDHTPVRDLAALRKLPLFYLDCRDSRVEDIGPLRGMGITQLFLTGCKVTDFSPLAGQEFIRRLDADFEFPRDAEVLRSIKKIESINGKPAEEFWKEFQPTQGK